MTSATHKQLTTFTTCALHLNDRQRCSPNCLSYTAARTKWSRPLAPANVYYVNNKAIMKMINPYIHIFFYVYIYRERDSRCIIYHMFHNTFLANKNFKNMCLNYPVQGPTTTKTLYKKRICHPPQLQASPLVQSNTRRRRENTKKINTRIYLSRLC